MTGNEYQKLAMRTNDSKATDRVFKKLGECAYINGNRLIDNEGDVSIGGVFNACLGLSGEVGEFNDMIKKWVFHEKELDLEHAKKEAGDICWYLAMLCESFGWALDDIMQINIDKLIRRYPDGFDTYLTNHRGKDDV